MIKKILFLLFFSIAYIHSFAGAKETDSLINILPTLKEDTNKAFVYNEISFALRRYDPAKGIQFATEGIALSRKIKSYKWLASLLNTKAILYRNTNDFDNAIKLAQEAITIADSIKDIRLRCTVNNTLGSLYNITGNYPQAQIYYLRFLKSAEELGDDMMIAKAMGNLANLFISQGKYKEALDYNLKSLAIKEKYGEEEDMAGTCTNIGLCYSHLKDYENAFKYHLRAFKYYEKAGDKTGMANNFNHIGYYYLTKKDYDKSLEYQRKALALQEELTDSIGLIYSYGNIAEVYSHKRDYKEAVKYYKKAEAIGISINVLYELSEIYAQMAKNYENDGDYKSALNYHKKLMNINDSLLNEKNNKSLIEMQTKYESDKKEKEIELLNKNKALQDSEITRQKTLRNSLFGIVASILLLSIVLYKAYKTKQKDNITLQTQKQEIVEKNEELNQQNEEIMAQRDLIEEQKYLVEEKNKEITDSIHYAKRIQAALLTSDSYINKYLSDFFIFYQPKDIVSGDFYWAVHHNNVFYIIAADCTGHGVPGAFMSLLNISFLNEVIIERGIKKPNEVLNHVRDEIIKALNPEGTETETKDGMDCILTAFDLDSMELTYAAANNSFYLIRDNQLLIQQADKMPVGMHHGEKVSFTFRTVKLQKGDSLYLFTDGYADQFGGPKGKKFKYKQLEEILMANHHLSMKGQKSVLKTNMDQWLKWDEKNYEQVDDMLVIGIRV